jgi:hypothetical protein
MMLSLEFERAKRSRASTARRQACPDMRHEWKKKDGRDAKNQHDVFLSRQTTQAMPHMASLPASVFPDLRTTIAMSEQAKLPMSMAGNTAKRNVPSVAWSL